MAIENEQQAEEALLAAVYAPDEQVLDGDKAEAADADELDIEAPNEAENEEAPQAKAPEPDPEDDFIEIEGEGGEKQKLAVKDVLADYQEYQQFKEHRQQVLERVQNEAVTVARQQLSQVEQWSKQAGTMVHAALQLLQAPQAPDPSMLDPSSAQYNPDKYHLAYAQFQRVSAQYQQAQQVGASLLKQAQEAEQAMRAQTEQREANRLLTAWPEFGKEETANKFIGDMQRAYGFSFEELDAVLVDHRQALVARDALAYRAMKAKGGDVKKQVEAKAPKLVRNGTTPKAPLRTRDAKGQFVGDALSNLRKSQSDESAAAYFESLLKAGRI